MTSHCLHSKRAVKDDFAQAGREFDEDEKEDRKGGVAPSDVNRRALNLELKIAALVEDAMEPPSVLEEFLARYDRLGLTGAEEALAALNKGTVTVQTLPSGPDYLRPSWILFPRILQIGATLNF